MKDIYKIFGFAVLITILLQTTSTKAQSTEHARFIIQDARVNNVDVSEYYVKNQTFLILYTNEDDNNVYLANVNPNQKTQSYGRIFNLKVNSEAETANSYGNDKFDFNWSYINTYDNKEGTANIHLLKIKKEGGIAFSCTIMSENLDVIVYKGYMEGSLKALY